MRHGSLNICYLVLLVTLWFPFISAYGQTDTLGAGAEFDSELLKLNVPEAFQQNSLKLEIFSDSSWILYRGQTELSFQEALGLLGQKDKIQTWETHLDNEAIFEADHRARRVFSSVATLVGGTYLFFVWEKGWVYQIPGYALLAVGGVRWWESRRAQIEAKRQRYYIANILRPSEVEVLVDAYNLRLYQFLSNTGIRYRDHEE